MGVAFLDLEGADTMMHDPHQDEEHFPFANKGNGAYAVHIPTGQIQVLYHHSLTKRTHPISQRHLG